MLEQVPVKVGEIHKVKILSVGAKGDGVCKIDGYTIFVPESKKDQQLNIKITRTLPRFAFAEIVNEENSEPEDTEDF